MERRSRNSEPEQHDSSEEVALEPDTPEGSSGSGDEESGSPEVFERPRIDEVAKQDIP